MLKNYFKTAFRSLWRNRQFSIINVAGLTLGMVVFLFIMQYVAFEWSANRFNENYNKLYRVNVQYKEGNTDYNLPPGFAPIIKQKFPAIDGYVRVADNIASGVITYTAGKALEKRVARADNMKYADTNFLSLFSFPIVAGSKVLLGPQTMAISEAMSIKLYGSTDVVDKTVTVSNQFGNTLYTVKAVYRLPQTSDIKADVLLSLQTLESAANRGQGNDWADPTGTGSGFTSIYLKLRNDVRAAALASDITNFVRSINPDSKTDVVYLQPFKELHLAPSFDYAFQTYGNLLLVVVFAIVATLILAIAWLNYINLSTAQALNRAKEVGVRKVLGASRMQLMLQHLTETLLLTLTSALVAFFTVRLLQPLFNDFAGRELSLAVLNTGWFWVAAVCMIVAGSALSGSYVAFVITSFRPSDAIRSNGDVSVRGLSVRKALVVFQFATSLVFIIATAVLYRQLQYMNNESLGMNLNQLVVIQGPTVTSDGQAARNSAFKNSLSQLPFVKKYTASNNVPGLGYNFFANGIGLLSATENDKRKSYGMFICDERFFDTYDIRFAQGSGFTKEDADASWNNVKKVIVNEKGAQQLGLDPKQPIVGQKITWGDNYEIVGVVKDYHHLSLREPIQPTVYLASPSFSFFTVQTDIRNMQSKIEVIRNLYNQSFAGNPFEYFFADERYEQQYAAEQQLGKVFIAAAFVAILIACLGLYGLAAFAARRRVKEVGIRKVLGASVASIAALLSKDFLKLVMVALLLASPIAWWIMNRWLQNFVYRTNISIWLFLVSGVVGVAIALITVSFQAVKAAKANPVTNLRSE